MVSIDRKTIGKKLRELREQRGESVSDLGKKIGVSESTIYMYEQGERMPRDAVKVLLIKHFGISSDFFLTQNLTYSEQK